MIKKGIKEHILNLCIFLIFFPPNATPESHKTSLYPEDSILKKFKNSTYAPMQKKFKDWITLCHNNFDLEVIDILFCSS